MAATNKLPKVSRRKLGSRPTPKLKITNIEVTVHWPNVHPDCYMTWTECPTCKNDAKKCVKLKEIK